MGEVVRRSVPEVFEVFQNAQYNTVEHKKCVKAMRKLYKKFDKEAFKEAFTNALYYALMFGDANGNVDRVLQFVSAFVTTFSDTQDEDFLRYVFDVVFDCVSVAGQSVRARSCQLLALLLSDLGDDASLDNDICDKILSTQLERLQDVRSAIRCRAVVTLQRLQDPIDENDPVTKAYIFHMSNDPSAPVRRAVVANLAKSSRNLLHVLERLCDVDESVRRAAYLYISAINVTQLKVRQRIHILKVGFAERNIRVRRIIDSAIIPGWLGTYQGNILDLLGAIRLDNLQGAKDSALVTTGLLNSLFKQRQRAELIEWLPIDTSLKLIAVDRLTKESVCYWRHLAQFLHSENDCDNLDFILPELITFTDYIRAILEAPCPPETEHKEFTKHQCIIQELINMFPMYDMADEVGRKALQSLLYDTLKRSDAFLNIDIVRSVMRMIDLVLPDVKKRIEFITGIISEIQEPIEEVQPPHNVTAPVESDEIKSLRARLRVSLNEALEEQEEAVRAQDFGQAAVCKDKVDNLRKELETLTLNTKESQVQEVVEVIKEKKCDPATVNKCLLILNMMLDSPQLTSLTPMLRSLFENFETMILNNPDIRENALQTVTLYSMMDEKFVQEHKAFLFTQFLDLNDEILVMTTLKCIIDIMCVHGIHIFDTPKDENADKTKEKSDKSVTKNKTSLDSDDEDATEETYISPTLNNSVIDLLLKLMNGESSEYRRIISEGFCRLMMSGQLSSTSLISHLLILWFNPATEEEDELRQTIGTFFPLYASNVEESQEHLEAAFLPTLTTLVNAPMSSPLSLVDPELMVKFMIGLTMPSVSPSASNVHSNLCARVLNALELEEEASELILCKTLSFLTLPKSISLCQDLLNSAEAISNIIKERTSYRFMSKFKANLAMTIENLSKRPSENPDIDRVSDIAMNNVFSSTHIESNQNNESPPNADALPLQNGEVAIENKVDMSKNNISCASPNPKRSKTTKESIARSTMKTPRSTRRKSDQTPLVTPLSVRRSSRRVVASERKATTRAPNSVKAKPKAARLKKVSTDEDEASPPIEVKKNPRKNATTKATKAVRSRVPAKKQKLQNKEKSPVSFRKSCIVQSSSDSSDDDTVLHTICHDESLGMQLLSESSSDEESNAKKKANRPNVTIPPSSSDSSDDSASTDEE